MLRFVEIEPFPRRWAKLGLEDEDLQALQIAIMASPDSHPVIRGSNGLRKLRFARPGSHAGKRGSYRVYYAYFDEPGIVLLMAILAKTERSDLSRADINAIAPILIYIKTLLDKGAIR